MKHTPNQSGRVLAIGDIHGHLPALQALAELVPFKREDLLVTLGDYVDRGPDSAGVLDWIIERSESGQLVPLRGNHEIMMVDSYRDPLMQHSWETVGGKETLDSYRARGFSGRLEDIPEPHRKFLRFGARPFFETETHFFVHANADPDVELINQPDFMLYWQKWNRPARHCSGKLMVCGHSSLRSGHPESNGNSVCIDTAVYRQTGWLTCLDVVSGEYWQANQFGDTRSDWLTVDAY